MSQERSDNRTRGFTIAGRPATLGGEKPNVFYSAISPDYFQVMQIPLLKGRAPAEQDTYSTPWVVVINEAMARMFWPNQDPSGREVGEADIWTTPERVRTACRLRKPPRECLCLSWTLAQ